VPWFDTGGRATTRWYVVQTNNEVVKRCILTDERPRADLVLDPTCAPRGTTAYVAEHVGGPGAANHHRHPRPGVAGAGPAHG